MEERRCVHCRLRFTPFRNPQQRYCGKIACQQKRRSSYQQKRIELDPEYKENYRLSQQKWCSRHPDYWRSYRLHHPAYTIVNRKAQASRDKRRRENGMETPTSVLAKMYSLFPENIYLSSNYNNFLGEQSVLAKMYVIGKTSPGLVMSSYDYLSQTSVRP
jgi:hypothetical protein